MPQVTQPVTLLPFQALWSLAWIYLSSLISTFPHPCHPFQGKFPPHKLLAFLEYTTCFIHLHIFAHFVPLAWNPFLPLLGLELLCAKDGFSSTQWYVWVSGKMYCKLFAITNKTCEFVPTSLKYKWIKFKVSPVLMCLSDIQHVWWVGHRGGGHRWHMGKGA